MNFMKIRQHFKLEKIMFNVFLVFFFTADETTYEKHSIKLTSLYV